MLSVKEKLIIHKCANKSKASKVILFESSLDGKEASDIDLEVKGITPELFYEF